MHPQKWSKRFWLCLKVCLFYYHVCAYLFLWNVANFVLVNGASFGFCLTGPFFWNYSGLGQVFQKLTFGISGAGFYRSHILIMTLPFYTESWNATLAVFGGKSENSFHLVCTVVCYRIKLLIESYRIKLIIESKCIHCVSKKFLPLNCL